MSASSLPYVVSLWSEDELRIEADLARAASLSLGRLVFDGAAVTHPHRMLTLHGPSVCEVRAAQDGDMTLVATHARKARVCATVP